MPTEVLIPEVMPKEALAIIEQSGVETSTVTQLRAAFNDMFANADKWLSQAKDIVVTDVTQTREMKMARECRLALRDIRCKAENSRKALKSDALAKGKAIDGIANVLKALVEPVEAYLQDQEDFAKRVEEQRRRDLHRDRLLALSAYMDVSQQTTDLSAMSQEQFDAMLTGAKMLREKEVADAADAETARVEAQRLANEKTEADRAERDRMLKEAQATAQIEASRRKTAEAQLETERSARETVERAEQARAQTELLAVQAPDKEKAYAFANVVAGLVAPKFGSPKGVEFGKALDSQLERFATWVTEHANDL